MERKGLDFYKLKEDLIRDEGYKREPYFDHLGYVSFGIGRNLIGNPLTNMERAYGARIGFSSPQFVNHLYENDINSVIDDLDTNFSFWRTLLPDSQRGLANMRFQLGPKRFREFKNSLSLIQAGHLHAAGVELRKSKWWREDTRDRAERTIRLIEGTHVSKV